MAPPSSLVATFYGGYFLELQKSSFFLVARPLPIPPPSPLLVTGRLKKTFFAASLKFLFFWTIYIKVTHSLNILPTKFFRRTEGVVESLRSRNSVVLRGFIYDLIKIFIHLLKNRVLSRYKECIPWRLIIQKMYLKKVTYSNGGLGKIGHLYQIC